MILILLGAPGTGKGTQAKLLSSEFQIPQISTGEILRAAIEHQTKTGLEAKKYIDQGELVPDAVMIALIQDRLKKDDCQRGFILDGFPRTKEQAVELDKLFAKANLEIDCVLGLEIAAEKIVSRLMGRRICRVCGKDYNVISNPPPPNNRCEVCGGEIVRRSDDTESVIRNRIAVYEEKTKPVKGYYQKAGKLKQFDADGSVEEIFLRLKKYCSQIG